MTRILFFVFCRLSGQDTKNRQFPYFKKNIFLNKLCPRMRKDRAMHNIVILGKADLHSETKRVSPAWAPVQQTGKSRPIHLHRFLAEAKNRQQPSIHL